MALFDRAWMETWRRLANADEGLPVIARYFTADLILGFGDTTYARKESKDLLMKHPPTQSALGNSLLIALVYGVCLFRCAKVTAAHAPAPNNAIPAAHK